MNLAGNHDAPSPRGLHWVLPGVAMAASLSLLAVAVFPSLSTHPVSHRRDMAMVMEEAGGPAEAGRPTTTVEPVSCRKLPDIPGKSLTTVLVEYPPDAYTPRHRHPGTVTAFVLKGTLRSQLLGSPAETYVAGQTWFEPPGAVHLFAENASKTEPAELLAIFVTDDDCGPLVIPD